MKKFLFFILILLVFSSFIFQKGFDERNLHITLHLDEYISQEEQWVYLHSFCSWISGNEVAIWDSAKIGRGQREVTLRGYALYDDTYNIFFSRRGPEKLIFDASPGDKLEIEITKADRSGRVFKRTKGNRINDEIMDLREIQEELNDKEMLAKLEGKNDSAAYYRNLITSNLVQSVQNTKYPSIACGNLLSLRFFYNNVIGEDSVQRLREYVAGKYPDYPDAELEEKPNIASELSISNKKRLAQLSAIRAKETNLTRSLAVGGKLALDLPMADGKLYSLYDVSKPYIFVDFWASWCKPCREEIPNIQNALTKYGNSLAVYAVSLDAFHEAWLRAIELDRTENFIHVTGVDKDRKRFEQIAELGISKIPMSFLLDKEHRIVARNLRGDDLINTLDSLLNQ